MKFSLSTLLGAVLLGAISFAAMSGHVWCYALLQTGAFVSFLASLIVAIYGKSPSSVFAGGWAICSGVTLGLRFLNIPILGAYAWDAPDPFQNHVVDLGFTFLIAFFGGSLARAC